MGGSRVNYIPGMDGEDFREDRLCDSGYADNNCLHDC